MEDKGLNIAGKVVLVAVKFSPEISSTGLIWAFNHVIQRGNGVKLLVVVPPRSLNKKFWGFPNLKSDCVSGHDLSFSGTSFNKKEYILESCTQMMLGLHQFYDSDKIKVNIRVVSGPEPGIVVAEAKKDQTHWVILDKRMKKEAKSCMEQLDCNVVLVKRSRPKFLRLNLMEMSKMETKGLPGRDAFYKGKATQVPNVTPMSSPEHTPFSSTEIGTSSISSFELEGSPNFIHEVDSYLKKDTPSYVRENSLFEDSDSKSDVERLSFSSTSPSSQQWVSEILDFAHEYSRSRKGGSLYFNKKLNLMFDSLLLKISELDKPQAVTDQEKSCLDVKTNVRDMVSLTSKAPLNPPPLCSICQHKAPAFGKPPRQFTFAELEDATNGFSQSNFLAEGGYGSVHRGVLPDGQVVAVKQRKTASSQGDHEFCSEVEVLSCAQHRNVVLLIGLCVEDGKRLLVYEYICNGSLDSHLYGRSHDPLDWSARHKIAIGAARGLRYLHEDCRVGCIVHRDVRPNNILLTHDFEPLVGDFGLARWQPDAGLSVETRIIGTFGYLAPEYAQSGQVTDKADVYSFGLILIELVSGRKAVDISRPKGEQVLIDWARPLLDELAVSDLVDPLLQNCYSNEEVHRMLHCASLCIQRDPVARPRISQVLRILEGDI